MVLRVEAADVGTWGHGIQVWGSWVSGGHLWRCGWSVDGSDVPIQDLKSLSELTTRPRMGEDCWSRGLQSACFSKLAGWRVVHAGRLLFFVISESLRQQLRAIGLYTHCLQLQMGAGWGDGVLLTRGLAAVWSCAAARR